MEADSAIILAGGHGKRMGFPKDSLRVKGERLLDLQYSVLRRHFRNIYVINNSLEATPDQGYQLVQDELEGVGPLGGIHAGLKVAQSSYSYVLACDMPYLNEDYIAFLRDQVVQNAGIRALVTACGTHLEPFNAIYHKSLVESISSFVGGGRRSITSFLRTLRTQEILVISEDTARRFSPDWSMFTNINTPEEYASLK